MTGPNYAAQAAIKCREPLFRQFLHEVAKPDISNPEWPAIALRYLSEVDSRSEFNQPAGAQKWTRVLQLFRKWRQGYSGTGHNRRPPFLMGQAAWRRGTGIDENPFNEGEGPAIDRPFDLWIAGWRNEKSLHHPVKTR